MGNRAQDKSVIVTGGSKGIGRGVAQVFANEGARVLLVGRHSDTGEPAAREIVDAGGAASFFRAGRPASRATSKPWWRRPWTVMAG